MSAEQKPWVVQAMCEPLFYDHPVNEVELIETHISWVFLAGEFAYKVKKPVNFDFLDFSTLAKRHHYCLEELRLNQRFSSQVYLAVVPIGGRVAAPAMNKQPVLEYAVKMRRFPQGRQLDRMLAGGRLYLSHMTAFAKKIAAFHQSAPPANSDTAFGSPAAVITPALDNFKEIRSLVKGANTGEQLTQLQQWTRQTCDHLQTIFRQRKAEGFIRECHGDVHLANMAWFDEQPLLFDCIEFNDNLRWIDVINDIAFLTMDLDDREQASLGWGFLNCYLQETGDYQGVTLLNFYKSYRAMVRAKVICLRLAQGHLDDAQQRDAERLFQSYLDLAEQYTFCRATPLILTHGLSGSGKTTFSTRLARAYGGIHIRSDIERKRLYGLAATAGSESPVGGGIYDAKAFTDTYSRLRDVAGVVLRSGFPAIVDATFIKKQQRDLFGRVAEDFKVPLIILDFPLAKEELRRRIKQRICGAKEDASEATVAVLEDQLLHQEPLTTIENKLVIEVHPDATLEEVTTSLRKKADSARCGI